MISKQLAIFLIVVALVFAVGQTLALAADTTAKAGLAQAQQAAKKWKADAALVNISTLTGNMDGTANLWTYTFHSPKAKQGYMVDVKDGKIVETLEVHPYIKDPVGGEFIDSPQVTAEARKNGLTVKGKPAMSLLIMGQATKNPGVYWTVGGGYTPGEVNVIVDAMTGKFFTRHEVK